MKPARLQHTPKPWGALKGVDGEPERWGVFQNNSDRHWWIATIENGAPGDTLETEAANARLIAAAPEMYDLIRRLSHIGRETDIESMAIEAAMLLSRIEGDAQ